MASTPPDLLFLIILSCILLCVALVAAEFTRRLTPKARRSELWKGYLPADTFVAVGLVSMLLLMGTQMLGAPQNPANRPEGISGAIQTVASVVLLQGTLLLSVLAWFRLFRKVDLITLTGVRRLGTLPVVKKAVTYLAPAFVVALGLNALSVHALKSFGMETPSQEAVQILQGSSGRAMQVAAFFLAVICAPVMEEFIFRGLLFGSLKTCMNTPAAVAISSLLFGAIHLNSPAFLSLALLGGAFAVAMHHTKSLMVSITMHAIFNLTMALTACFS